MTMSQIDQSFQHQLVVAPTDGSKQYLGNAAVVHAFVGKFASDVMRAYDGFLSGRAPAAQVQSQIDDLIREHGEAFMGNDSRYEIAPWQGKRMKGKLLAALPAMKGDDDPGDALFRFLALQCVKASMSLADGHSDTEVGAHLKEILDDVRGRILGVIA
jgi:hypothetical protein